MSAMRDYNRFLADTGAGVDAAGRLAFDNPVGMYAGPSEHASAARTLRQAEARMAGEESEAERRQRIMMDQLSRYAPPTGYKFDFRMLHGPSSLNQSYKAD
jgi:hypothetical protein